MLMRSNQLGLIWIGYKEPVYSLVFSLCHGHSLSSPWRSVLLAMTPPEVLET